MPASSSSASDKIYRTDERRRAADVISREVNMKEAARLLRLIPGGGTGGIMWKLLMMAHKLNRTGSSLARFSSLPRPLHRMPQDNNATQEEEERGGERLLPHTSLEFNVNQGEGAGVPKPLSPSIYCFKRGEETLNACGS